MLRIGLSLGLVSFALLAGFWSLRTLPDALNVQLAAGTVRQIMRGETVAAETLAEAKARLDAIDPRGCYERHLWQAIVLHLYQFEKTPETALTARSRQLADIRRLSEQLASCSPRQALGWFVLAWVDIIQDGVQAEALEKLALSYRLAPREGWIARVRNPLAVRLYPFVDEPLREAIRVEFADLVRARMFAEAARSVQRASSVIALDLVDMTGDLPLEQRQHFANQLASIGLPYEVPGVSHQMQRPWR
jgi:hypothetical protein